MKVYLEVTYCMNAFIILLSFELLCFLLNIQMTKKELLKYVMTYNISFIFLFLDLFDGFILLYNLFLTFFYFRKQTYIYYPIYIFIYISLLSFLEFCLPHSLIFQGVLLIEELNITSISIIAFLSCIIIYFYVSFCSYKLNQEDMIDVSFLNIKCLGFIDNGNKVFYKGYPVIFISKHLLNEYRAIDTIDVSTAHSLETIDIILLDDIDINHQTLHHVYAGLMSSSEYDCILNTQLMGGLL